MKKQKKLGRKLVVNKQTIARLDRKSTGEARGGITGEITCLCSKWCLSRQVVVCPCLDDPYTS